jgi:hypothetical protein
MFGIDIWLEWVVIAIPFIVTVGAAVLTLKLPHEKHYWKFVGGSGVIGLVFSGLTFWQLSRAAHQSVQDRYDTIAQTVKKIEDQEKPYFKSQTDLIRDQNEKIVWLQKS